MPSSTSRPATQPGKRAAEPEGPPKGRKKRRTQGPGDDDAGPNSLVAAMDSPLLADHLRKQTSRFGSDLTPLELADLSLPASAIVDSSSWPRDRTLAQLPAFLEHFAGGRERLAKAPVRTGTPRLLVVAAAGLRAADLVRALRQFASKENTVAKLFAKHIKIDEQVAFLQSRRTGIGVGTPARLTELLDKGALAVDKLESIVIDASHIDQKKRGIMDMKDTMMPLARFLARKEFKSRFADVELSTEKKIKKQKPLAVLFY